MLLHNDGKIELSLSYLNKSLEVARRQKAKSWELRTATSLACLYRDQSLCAEAIGLLAPVYDTFTEGFDTRDLKEAKALLDELNLNNAH